jgi:hypothetical protein
MACEESSWQKYGPPTIRVELNPKTILIASAADYENLCKIFTRKGSVIAFCVAWPPI